MKLSFPEMLRRALESEHTRAFRKEMLIWAGQHDSFKEASALFHIYDVSEDLLMLDSLRMAREMHNEPGVGEFLTRLKDQLLEGHGEELRERRSKLFSETMAIFLTEAEKIVDQERFKTFRDTAVTLCMIEDSNEAP